MDSSSCGSNSFMRVNFQRVVQDSDVIGFLLFLARVPWHYYLFGHGRLGRTKNNGWSDGVTNFSRLLFKRSTDSGYYEQLTEIDSTRPRECMPTNT